MDANNKLLMASKVQWEHGGQVWSEDLKVEKRASGKCLSLVDRMTIASRMLDDVEPHEATQIWFGGRLHTVVEDDMHRLWKAVHAAEMARCKVMNGG